ncbi:magnesium transporter CorA family protein [Candidatus Woesearchaeota archaeon]|nr:magnesium transporter CorA family protein [Candidatus Woesearchaeota archaeon]
MIKYLLFRNGKVNTGSSLDFHLPRKDEKLFIFLTQPNEAEIKRIIKDFKIEGEPLRTFSKETHSRRYIAKPFQFVMRTPHVNKNAIAYSNLLFIMTNRAMIVAVSAPSDFYNEIVDDIAESFEKVQVRSVGHLLYNFLKEDVDENYDVLGTLEKRIKDIESRASRVRGDSRIKVEDILALKSQLFRLSRQFWATTRVISLIRIGVAKIEMDPESAGMLVDLHETFLHQIDLSSAQKDMVTDVLTVYATSVSNLSAITANELNVVIKKITSYAALLLIPTLVASIYGMNFAHLPLAEHQYGFYLIMAAMITVTGVTLASFIKNDWL